MTFRELEKLLKADGWKYVGARGSHYMYEHPTKPGKITIPHRSGDLKKKTAQTILKQAGH